MKIALITDTHLAAIAEDFIANCDAAIDWINGSGAELVIHLGDITADGIEAPEQISMAGAVLARIAPPLLCVPGNHDIGDNPVPGVISSHKPFDLAMLSRFRETFGADRWRHQADGWTLLGLNAELFGTDSDEEHLQAAWLDAELKDVREPIGLFLHKPWFRYGLDDIERHSRYVPLEVRLALAARFAPHDLRFIASGHTHQWREHRVEGIDHYWVPSTAFVVPDVMQEWIGTKLVGLGMLTLDPAHHCFDYIHVPAMRRLDLADYAELFPKVRAAMDGTTP